MSDTAIKSSPFASAQSAKSADAVRLAERVAAIPYWYHRIELPGGIVTPGNSPICPAAYRIPADLSGARVLDVGAWDGYWSFEALRRGAASVVAIDTFQEPEPRAPGRVPWDTFDLCREALGYDADRCQRLEMSVYDAAQLGPFDIVFCFGLLYHLRHPLLALDVLSKICRDRLCIESAILDDVSPYRGVGQGYGDEMVMEFYPGDQYGGNPSNWWVPTLHCLAQMVLSCGWDEARRWKLTTAPQKLALCRGFVQATRTPEAQP